MDEQQFEYRTGQTHPDKSLRGLVAGLLICVILLSGLVSALGLMNIRLFHELKLSQQDVPLSFSQGEPSLTAEDSLFWEGMSLQEPDPVYQQLHELPQGLYIVQVKAGSNADKLGVQPGDLLISWNGISLSTLDSVRSFLDAKLPGDTVPLLLHRDGEEFSLTVTISQ